MADPTASLALSLFHSLSGHTGVYAVRATYAWYDPTTGTISAQAPLVEQNADWCAANVGGWPTGGLITGCTVSTEAPLTPHGSTPFGLPGVILCVAQQDTSSSPWSSWYTIATYGTDPTPGYLDWGLPIDLSSYPGAIPVPDVVRLHHGSGPVCWDHDSRTHKVYSESAVVLETPFAILTEPPATFMGRDPDTGLPAYCSSPMAPVSSLPVPSPVPPVVPPAPGDACIQTRCGAAVALQTKLVAEYDNWRNWINAAVSFAVGGLIAAVLAEIGAVLVAAEVAAWVLQVFKIVSPIIGASSSVALPHLIPVLTIPQEDQLLGYFFCALACEGGEVALSVANQHAVSAAIVADTTTFPSDLMRELLGEIVYYDPLQDWQAAMSNAPVSGLCDGMTCP